MAFTLVVNPGSSSKKYALYADNSLQLNAHIERSEDGFEMCTSVKGLAQKCESLPKQDYQASLQNFLQLAIQAEIVSSAGEIEKVAIRVVAPGTFFQRHQIINEDFLAKLKAVANLAPLHIPHVEREIRYLIETIPSATLVAVSDSAFHSSLPEKARQYSLPKSEVEHLDLFRFGYHGLSVASVLRRYESVVGSIPGRVIVCHIGSGVSVTATLEGKSVDTTMGFSPGSGLIMGSRAGDVDAGALLALMQLKNLKPIDAELYLQTSGGLKGISGEADLRYILDRKAKDEADATLAITSFVYQIQKAIGAYMATLNGLDTLVFTATAGVRSPVLRSLIVDGLAGLGLSLDDNKNLACTNGDAVISKSGAPIKVVVLRTDEENEILYASLALR